MLSVAQISAVLNRIIASHPGKEFIFTVSPIRHMGEGAHLNTISKASLQMAVEGTGAAYFPAYEILLDELRDYRWFAEDLVHPTKAAADYIWERFNEAILSKSPASRQSSY
jgi:lysophospholipase L1-like esterase